MKNFPSPWRVNFAGQVVRDVDDVEEVLRKVSSPERNKSVIASPDDTTDDHKHQKTNNKGGKKDWSWFRLVRKNKNNTKGGKQLLGGRLSSLNFLGAERPLISQEYDDRGSYDSESDLDSYLEYDDDSATVETMEHTIETVNTWQYKEFIRQEKQEEGWSVMFCGACGRQDDFDDDDDHDDGFSQASILTRRTKPSHRGTTYDMQSRRTVSVLSDSDSSESFDSDDAGEIGQIPPIVNECSCHERR